MDVVGLKLESVEVLGLMYIRNWLSLVNIIHISFKERES